MSSWAQVSTLRAHLLTALSAVPGSRTFHLHVLVSTPRKPGQSLFLYADTRPKCFVQDVLVLLSEETPNIPEHGSPSVNPCPSDASIRPAPRTFVTAIEASVYAFPVSHSTILYISKVDGTGQGAYPSPTSTLLRAFLIFYASTKSALYASPTPPYNLWIHLFARSQRQYLFPNSAEHPNKKPLGDVALCKWWKRMLSDVAKKVETDDAMAASDAAGRASEANTTVIRLYHLLPGQTELEASYLLRDARSLSSLPRTPWIYSHPYSTHTQGDIPFPSENISEPNNGPRKIPPLAYLIPHFDDDPKSRFLDELAATSEEQAVAVPVPTPRRKRQRTKEGTETLDSTLGIEDIGQNAPEITSCTAKDKQGACANVETTNTSLAPQPSAPSIMYIPPSSSPPQVDARSPSLRSSTPEAQQNITLSPHTPHLPTLPASLLSPHTPPNVHGPPLAMQTSLLRIPSQTPQTPRTPRRPKSDLDTISPIEFWERMSFRQECALGAVTGFFVGVFSRRVTTSLDETSHPSSRTTSGARDSNDLPSTLLSIGTIPHSVLKRVMSSLLTGVEFSTAERANKGTHVMESAIKGLCDGLDEGNSYSDHAINNSEAIDVGMAMTQNVYATHVYTSFSTSNPSFVRNSGDSVGPSDTGTTPPVNVLGVRRRKKRD